MKKSKRYASRYTAKLKKRTLQAEAKAKGAANLESQVKQLTAQLKAEMERREPAVTTIKIGKAIAGGYRNPHMLGLSVSIDVDSLMFSFFRTERLIDIRASLRNYAMDIARKIEDGLVEHICKDVR